MTRPPSTSMPRPEPLRVGDLVRYVGTDPSFLGQSGRIFRTSPGSRGVYVDLPGADPVRGVHVSDWLVEVVERAPRADAPTRDEMVEALSWAEDLSRGRWGTEHASEVLTSYEERIRAEVLREAHAALSEKDFYPDDDQQRPEDYVARLIHQIEGDDR